MWNVGGYDQITEYRVPDKPIKTLSIPGSFPTSCAMNTSGDLAVGVYDGSGDVGGGNVVIFKNASGSGTAYGTPLDEEFFDGYDNQGNLFADGFTGNRSGFALVELPKGGSKFETIDQQCGAVPRLRTVGRHLRDRLRSAIERVLPVQCQRNEGDA